MGRNGANDELPWLPSFSGHRTTWLASGASEWPPSFHYFCCSPQENWVQVTLITMVTELTLYWLILQESHSSAVVWTFLSCFLLLRVREELEPWVDDRSSPRGHDNDGLLCQTKFQSALHLLEIKHLLFFQREWWIGFTSFTSIR